PVELRSDAGVVAAMKSGGDEHRGERSFESGGQGDVSVFEEIRHRENELERDHALPWCTQQHDGSDAQRIGEQELPRMEPESGGDGECLVRMVDAMKPPKHWDAMIRPVPTVRE